MAQIVVEKKEPRIVKWVKKNKKPLGDAALMSATMVLIFTAGYVTDSITYTLKLQAARADGFIKLFNPETGEEVDFRTYKKLLKSFYNK